MIIRKIEEFEKPTETFYYYNFNTLLDERGLADIDESKLRGFYDWVNRHKWAKTDVHGDGWAIRTVCYHPENYPGLAVLIKRYRQDYYSGYGTHIKAVKVSTVKFDVQRPSLMSRLQTKLSFDNKRKEFDDIVKRMFVISFWREEK